MRASLVYLFLIIWTIFFSSSFYAVWILPPPCIVLSFFMRLGRCTCFSNHLGIFGSCNISVHLGLCSHSIITLHAHSRLGDTSPYHVFIYELLTYLYDNFHFPLRLLPLHTTPNSPRHTYTLLSLLLISISCTYPFGSRKFSPWPLFSWFATHCKLYTLTMSMRGTLFWPSQRESPRQYP